MITLKYESEVYAALGNLKGLNKPSLLSECRGLWV